MKRENKNYQKVKGVNLKAKLAGMGLILLLLMVVASCSDRLNGINRNLKHVQPSKLKIDGAQGRILLPAAELNITSPSPGSLQLMRNLGPDSYAGYMTTPTPFLGNANSVTYRIVDGWANAAWSIPRQALNSWLAFVKNGYDTKYPDLYGIALICKVFAASQPAAIFGPIPYTHYGESSTVPFDGQETLYDGFFSDLDLAIKNLKAKLKANPNAGQVRFKPVDKSTYGGHYAKWIKLAKTLKLRLAIRISLVAPKKAKKEAEEAVKGTYGVLESGDGSFAIRPPSVNGYNTIINSWGDCRIAASIVSVLKGYHDPRLAKYVLPATDPDVSGTYKGIRPAVVKPAKSRYEGFSKPNIKSGQPLKLLDVSASYFLRAEGVLRGWDMGNAASGTVGWTAGQFYKAGVRASFKENGLSGANAYLANDSSFQASYVDPKNSANNSPPLNKITVKWNPGASKTVKLKKIIMQRWIASWPNGVVGWAMFRRTGYPKMYPPKVNDSGGAIPLGGFIKRWPYTTVFTNASKKQVGVAVNKYLNGNNTIAQPLWWDVPEGPLNLVNH